MTQLEDQVAGGDVTAGLLGLVQRGVRCYDLARPYEIGMPQSPNHPAYWHTLPRRHGDGVRADGASAANDLIVTGTHVGTHIDALAHVSQDGKLFGGADAAEAQIGGRFTELGVHTIPPLVRRGVMLDIPRALGVDPFPGAYEITPDDLDLAVEQQGTAPRAGDVLLIRSGWGSHWHRGPAYIGKETGVPGPGESAARWIADRGVVAAGADSIAFEHLPAGAGHGVLPAHRILLVETGVYIIETLNLEELAQDGVHEFLLALTPLPLVGATGSPVRPIAIVGDE